MSAAKTAPTGKTKITLSELLRRQVVTESGQRLGRVHDVRGTVRGRKLLVDGLVVGRRGFLEHYGLDQATRQARPGQKAHAHSVIPLARVLRVGEQIVVADEA